MDKQWAAPWGVRRRLIMATVLYCAGEVTYLTIWGRDTELHQAIAVSLILLAGSTIGSYVFGAAWDNKNERDAEIRARGARRFRPDPNSPADQPPEGFAE